MARHVGQAKGKLFPGSWIGVVVVGSTTQTQRELLYLLQVIRLGSVQVSYAYFPGIGCVMADP
jgi:hypothetical protein